jgi:hypothetical protein
MIAHVSIEYSSRVQQARGWRCACISSVFDCLEFQEHARFFGTQYLTSPYCRIQSSFHRADLFHSTYPANQ